MSKTLKPLEQLTSEAALKPFELESTAEGTAWREKRRCQYMQQSQEDKSIFGMTEKNHRSVDSSMLLETTNAGVV